MPSVVDQVGVRLRDGAALGRRLLGGTPDRVEPLVQWDHKAAYRCDVGGESFVCKVDIQIAEIRREVDGLVRAAAAGIPVPEVVATGEGELAMRWVEGTALTSGSPSDWWRSAGRELRRVHAVNPLDMRPGGGFSPARDTWAAAIEAEADEELARWADEGWLDAAAVARIREAITNAHDSLIAAPPSWYHGDLQPDHILVDAATGDVAAIIDWSDQGRGDAAWDLTVLTLDDLEHLDAVLDGYDTDPAERERLTRMLPFYRLVRWLGEARWLSDHGYRKEAAASIALASAWGRA
jgi:aminoglycoside phosphotransferase (APT) family kinase protein